MADIKVVAKVRKEGKTIGYRVLIDGMQSDLTSTDAIKAIQRFGGNAIVVSGKFLRLKEGSLQTIDIANRKKGISSIKVSGKNVISTTTSKGNQPKWVIGNTWLKRDLFGYEGLAETIASELLRCTNIDHVKYYTCFIESNGKKYTGCYSYNFLDEGESFITFNKIIKSMEFDIEKESKRLSSKELMLATINVVNDYCGIDVTKYVADNLLIDAIIMNEDRHLNNLGVVKTASGFRYAPIFDNGLSLLSDEALYSEYAIGDAIKKVRSKPFSSRFEKQVKIINQITPYKIVLNYDEVKYMFSNYKNGHHSERRILRAFGVIRMNLRALEGKAWVRL